MRLSAVCTLVINIFLLLPLTASAEQPPFPVMDSNFFSYGAVKTPMAPKPLTPLDQDFLQSRDGDLRFPKKAETSRRRGSAKKEIRCTTVYGPHPTAQSNYLAQTINQLCGGPPSVHFRANQLRTFPTNLNPYNPTYGQQRPKEQTEIDGTYVVCCPPKVLQEYRHPVVE
jgi:hypothetical protein